MKGTTITIVTGRSGSGKSTALAAFEDSGYCCVDNMPVALLPSFLDLPSDHTRVFAGLAFGMDLRDDHFLKGHEPIFDAIRAKGFRFQIIFLEADAKTLLRRYSQTRRRHPLALNQSLLEAILAEERILDPLRRKADHRIDTAELTVHDLKAIVRKLAHSAGQHAGMQVEVISFGFRYGLPLQLDLLMDVRFLSNPFFVDDLRPLSGETEKVRSFVLNSDQTALFMKKYVDLLDMLIPQYENEGKSYLTIAIGCTGGRHRSVVIAKQLFDHIAGSGRKTQLTHRDIDKSLSL